VVNATFVNLRTTIGKVIGMNPEYVYRLAAEEWDAFLRLLDKPAEDMPKLRLLMNSPSPFDEEK
jgi:uncharacterized protein (DUF1778 family)